MSVESQQIKKPDLSLETIVLYVSDMVASRSFYEGALGLRALDWSPHVARYSAGHVQLSLLPAAEHEVTLAEGRDKSADITFIVDNFARSHELLTARGVRFSRTLEYIVGVTADFYDPDGHWFSLYQPSEAAMQWPSGRKLETLSSGLSMQHPAEVPPVEAAAQLGDLGNAYIAYVFMFFNDPDIAAGFYGDVMGFEAIEGGPCRRIATSADVGVVKYDVGATMLTTHHVEPDDKRFRVSTTGTSGVAMAFRVANLAKAMDTLSRRGITFPGSPSESPIGRLAQFTDPVGHRLLLREAKQEGERSVGGAMPVHAAVEN